jgi:hypothetical protein
LVEKGLPATAAIFFKKSTFCQRYFQTRRLTKFGSLRNVRTSLNSACSRIRLLF